MLYETIIQRAPQLSNYVSLILGIHARPDLCIICLDRLPGVSYRRMDVARCPRPIGEGGTTINF